MQYKSIQRMYILTFRNTMGLSSTLARVKYVCIVRGMHTVVNSRPPPSPTPKLIRVRLFEDGPARLGGGEEKEKEAAPQGPPDSCPLAPPPKALNLIDGIPPRGKKKAGGMYILYAYSCKLCTPP